MIESMPTLDELYQQTIEDQKKYLLKLQEDFNKKCDEIKTRAQDRLKKIPGEDKEMREQILLDQKEELEAILRDLKGEVDTSTRKTLKRLEEINSERERKILEDLEKQIAAL